jgi:hypothetical protein
MKAHDIGYRQCISKPGLGPSPLGAARHTQYCEKYVLLRYPSKNSLAGPEFFDVTAIIF